MNKDQKINYIKAWLQMFGERDNDTFTIDVVIDDDIIWSISLQYGYDLDGDRLKPNDWCTKSFKHVKNNTISDRSDTELDSIITNLNLIKTYN